MDNEPLCMFHKEGKCNSSYGEGIACNGINVPKGCPYPFGELRGKNAKPKKKDEHEEAHKEAHLSPHQA